MVLVTEWKQFRELTPELASAAKGRVLIDGRNCVDAVAWRAAGWTYRGLGRP